MESMDSLNYAGQNKGWQKNKWRLERKENVGNQISKVYQVDLIKLFDMIFLI